ncbi:zinc metalloproteinase nas-14-like [Paramacrobiotus metropolitanus]|uniref:zinc metalloproteinase nas-14-like n=1 Tax=Paramacrobiotus metropolitanus TaxID=2943436 RepID=UPI00244582B2|nr:zinc metalloproteinase nas-14-like [Paramacrobiotus metropolitanus]XP_055349091.1 zinc metalloproteinase nas-14-like [Paramacrobiotus metropolitanus]
MHVMGFVHEHSRSDRDNYVTIIWDNIAKSDVDQFAKHEEGNTYGLPYDYESVMHYKHNAFAKNSSFPTILPTVRNSKIGQNKNLSPMDVVRINRRFRCGVPDPGSFIVNDGNTNTATESTTETNSGMETNSEPVVSENQQIGKSIKPGNFDVIMIGYVSYLSMAQTEKLLYRLLVIWKNILNDYEVTGLKISIVKMTNVFDFGGARINKVWYRLTGNTALSFNTAAVSKAFEQTVADAHLGDFTFTFGGGLSSK